MVNNVIKFTVLADGEISPKVEQAAGVQGSHNVTQVVFDVSALNYVFANTDTNTDADTNIRTRIQFIDGAGGFESTGFLDVVSDGDKKFVSALVPRCITNAGGVAKVNLVVTEIEYDADGMAYEDEVFLSKSGKIRFESSGVGSPSNDMYLKGISSALVNAEIFVGQAETASDTAEQAKDNAETAATSAASSAASAASELQALRDGIANGDFKGEPGPQGPQGDKGDKGDKGEPGETPSLDGVIQFWQKNTEYKVGDYCLWQYYEESGDGKNPTSIYYLAYCIGDHTSSGSVPADLRYWQTSNLCVTSAIKDGLGRYIVSTYATKEEVGNIETALDKIIEIQNQLIGGGAE